MKKFLCVFLSILFLLLTSCSYKTEKQNSSEKTTINSDNSEITSAPHSNISAEQLTNEQAREILEVLIPKQFEVFFLFQFDSQKIDETQIMPGNAWYVLCTDERFSCVQDIKDYILQVYTGNQAKWYFDIYLDCEPTTSDINFGCYYLDYDGRLYCNTVAGGKGLNYSKYLMDTTRIIERTESTVAVEIDAEDIVGSPHEIYKFLLCKTQNGWRLDSRFLDSYYLD